MASRQAALLTGKPNRQPRKERINLATAASVFKKQVADIRRIGGLLDIAYIQHMPMDAVELLNEAYEQGLESSPLAVRFPGNDEGARDTHRNRDVIEKHMPLFYLAGQLVAEAKNMHGTQTLKDVFGALNRDDWRTVLQGTRVCNLRAHGQMGTASHAVPYLPEH